jgi:outer membrane protein assembly factor BamB
MQNSSTQTAALENSRTWPVRVWPGLVIVAVMLLMLFVPPFFIERTKLLFDLLLLAPVFGMAAGLLWWLRYSRAPRFDRIGVTLLFLVPFLLFATELAVAGVRPMGPLIYGVPAVLTLWVAWLILSRPLPWGIQRFGLYAVVLLGWLGFATLRVEQTDADLVPNLTWRWLARPEDAFASRKAERGSAETKPTAANGENNAAQNAIRVNPGDWAEFRGPNRDNRLTGVNLDVTRFPKAKQLWKVPIGPGWGSFSVVGDRLFTQEQQGESEAIICLDANSGKQIWEHTYTAKFTEQIAGAGPRSTPTVHEGRVYSVGATGMLKCLEAATGSEVWTVGMIAAANAVRVEWGFACSPLVTDGLVIVCTNAGATNKGLTAFDAKTGKVAWQAGQCTHGYSSAQKVSIGGVEQVLLASNYGLESFEPKTGRVLWEHEWFSSGNRTTQPVVIGDGEFLLGTGVGILATRRLKVTKSETGWDVQKVWETRRMSPYYNDGVAYKGHYYGFSGNTFHCVDLADGQEKWSAGAKYGNGQVLLLADQGLLVVSQAKRSLTEVGSVFVLEANPEDHTELANLPTIQGKTWNHPSIAHGRLYIRNGVDAACYELPIK